MEVYYDLVKFDPRLEQEIYDWALTNCDHTWEMTDETIWFEHQEDYDFFVTNYISELIQYLEQCISHLTLAKKKEV